jgi:hypothetical protein
MPFVSRTRVVRVTTAPLAAASENSFDLADREANRRLFGN